MADPNKQNDPNRDKNNEGMNPKKTQYGNQGVRPDQDEGQGEEDNRGQPARGGKQGENPSSGQRTSGQ